MPQRRVGRSDNIDGQKKSGMLQKSAVVHMKADLRQTAKGDRHVIDINDYLSYPGNRDEWQKLKPHPDDGLILCGDVGEKAEHLDLAFSVAKSNFKEVWWCPGNHELYSMPLKTAARGEDKYKEYADIARRHGVHTPEDPFVHWDEVIVAPIFTLYDYSFRPSHLTSTAAAIAWAEETNTVAADEALLFPDPHPSREAWCSSLVAATATKLDFTIAASPETPLILVNHWPLRQDLVFIPRIARFSIWCGTTLTEDWHTRFNAAVVISGHLHVPRTDWRDGVRFEEVSLGYPREWNEVKDAGKDVNDLFACHLAGSRAAAGACCNAVAEMGLSFLDCNIDAILGGGF